MNGKRMILVSAALLFTLSMWKFGPSQQAHCAVEPDAPPRVVWEYRVVWISAPDKEERWVAPRETFEQSTESLKQKIKKDAEDMTRTFNDLAADGWEYAEKIKEVRENKESFSGAKSYDTGVFVLMKRPKKQRNSRLKFLLAPGKDLGYKG